MKELADRDIGKYVLPKRERIVVVETEDGQKHEFRLVRPCLRDRNALNSKYNLNKQGADLLKDEGKMLEYMKDVILLVAPDLKKTAIDIDKMDTDIFELLFSECTPMLGLGEKDQYFRYKSGPKE